jgi:hypothetical protein
VAVGTGAAIQIAKLDMRLNAGLVAGMELMKAGQGLPVLLSTAIGWGVAP